MLVIDDINVNDGLLEWFRLFLIVRERLLDLRLLKVEKLNPFLRPRLLFLLTVLLLLVLLLLLVQYYLLFSFIQVN